MPLEEGSGDYTSIERNSSETNVSTTEVFPNTSTESNPSLSSLGVIAKNKRETHCKHSLSNSTSVVCDIVKNEDNSPSKHDHAIKGSEYVEIEMEPVKCGTCGSCGQEINVTAKPNETEKPETFSCLLAPTTNTDLCRICHCGGDECSDGLIAPCKCKGSLTYVHHECLQRWIKSSGYKRCELCGFQFAMDTKLKPLFKWEKLPMSKTERRKVCCSVAFHLIAIICVVWSIYVLVERTINELNIGTLDWPFWTKLVVVAVGMIGSLVFMYVQCKTYTDLWRRLKANNRIIYVQSQPEAATDNGPAAAAEDKVGSLSSKHRELNKEPPAPADNRSDYSLDVL